MFIRAIVQDNVTSFLLDLLHVSTSHFLLMILVALRFLKSVLVLLQNEVLVLLAWCSGLSSLRVRSFVLGGVSGDVHELGIVLAQRVLVDIHAPPVLVQTLLRTQQVLPLLLDHVHLPQRHVG